MAGERHSWVKLRLHVYMCRRCGTGYENKQRSCGGWFRTYYLPDRSKVNSDHVPPCAPGPTTAKRLEKYAAAVACDPGPAGRRVVEGWE